MSLEGSGVLISVVGPANQGQMLKLSFLLNFSYGLRKGFCRDDRATISHVE